MINFIKELAKKIDSMSGQTFYVGGYIRDTILGISNEDIDIEVHGISAESLKSILSTFGTVKLVGESFGVFRVGHYDIDIALPRTETSIGNAHQDFDVSIEPFIGTKLASKRRDFTINALMKNILTGEIIDEWGGLSDLQNGIIRHIDDKTFIEDPLRVLRAAGFAARFNFEINEQTLQLCSTIDISNLPKERIFEELSKALLKSNTPSIFFENLNKMGHLNHWFPELQNLQGILQSELHHSEGDAYVHTMMVINNAAQTKGAAYNPLSFMLSALCHDFGKAVTTEITDGKITAYGHDVAGVDIANTFIKRLTNENNIRKQVLNHVELHMKPNMMILKSRKKSLMKLWDSSVCPYDLILLAEADKQGRYNGQTELTQLQIQSLNQYLVLMKTPEVSGKDLIALGLKPSPLFTEILEFTHKLHLAGRPKEDAIRQAIGTFKIRTKENKHANH